MANQDSNVEFLFQIQTYVPIINNHLLLYHLRKLTFHCIFLIYFTEVISPQLSKPHSSMSGFRFKIPNTTSKLRHVVCFLYSMPFRYLALWLALSSIANTHTDERRILA